MKDFYIENATKKDIMSIKMLINEGFGANYHQKKTLIGSNCISLIAKLDDEIIGFASVLINKNWPNSDFTALLDILVVKIEHQGKGYGSELFKARITALHKLRVKKLILHHWVKKGRPEPHIALNHGFKLSETIPNYWAKDSVRQNYHCAECGPPPCSCSCKIYQKITIT